MARGAIGAVSGLASAFPDVVRGALDQPDDGAEARLTALRGMMETQPFIAAAKHVLARRGVPIRPDMRRPMRPLTVRGAVGAGCRPRSWRAAAVAG